MIRHPNGVGISVGSYSNTGNVRAENQDALLVSDAVILVADGMGGHQHGREAAETVVASFEEASADDPWLSPAVVRTALEQSLSQINQLAAGSVAPPGSTVTGIGPTTGSRGPAWLVFNVGDSRTYLFRDDELSQITVDHSQTQQLLDEGLSQEEADRLVGRNVITRAVGGGLTAVPEADQWVVPMHLADRLVMCSDGLTGEVTDAEIREILADEPRPQEAADALGAAALAAGGSDNVTIVVADIVLFDPADDDTMDDTLRGAPEDTVDGIPGALPELLPKDTPE